MALSEEQRQEWLQEVHNKGQEDGASGSGYDNPANSWYNTIFVNDDFNHELSQAYIQGFDNGQDNRPRD